MPLRADCITEKIAWLKECMLRNTLGKYDQAVKHMEDFIKHLNNPPMDNRISNNAKEILNLDAKALIEIWKSLIVEVDVPAVESQDSTVTDNTGLDNTLNDGGAANTYDTNSSI